MAKVLRWTAVLPGAVIAAVLATFLLRIVLYQTLTGSGLIQPYPETPERLLTPLMLAIAFVWAGARIAPKHNLKVAIVLCSLWILILGGMFALAMSGANVGSGQLYLQY